MDGRRHKNALSHGCRHLEDRMGNQAAYFFIHQAVFAFSRGDMKLLPADLIVDLVTVKAGGVHHDPGLVSSLLCLHKVALYWPFRNSLYALIQMELHAVHRCIFRQGDRQLKGTDDASGRRMKGADHLFRKGGFQRQKFLFLQDFQPFYAVFFSLLQELFQTGAVLLVKAEHQRTVSLIGKIQLPGKLFHHLASPDVHFRLPAAGNCIKTGMGDAAVCLGGARTDVLPLFKQGSLQIIAGKLSCDRRACYTPANDQYIIHFLFLLLPE